MPRTPRSTKMGDGFADESFHSSSSLTFWRCAVLVALGLASAMTGCHNSTHREQQEQAHQDWNRLRADFKISLASQQFEQGHAEDAIVTLQEAIALDPTTSNHHLLLAKCYLEQGSLASAQQAM